MTMGIGGKQGRMRIIKLIFFMILVMPLMLLLSGCFDDSILDAIKAEKDFIAPYTVVEERPNRTVYFEISDSRRTGHSFPGNDALYVDVPNKIDLEVHNNLNVTGHNVVADNVSKLMWTKCSFIESGGGYIIDDTETCENDPHAFEWIEAVDILEKEGLCDKLNYAGFTNWRMPTASELFSLMNFDLDICSLDSDKFPRVHDLDVYYYPCIPDSDPCECYPNREPCSPDSKTLNKTRRSYSFWSFTSKYIPYEVYTAVAYYELSYYFQALTHEKRTSRHFVRCVRNNI